MPIIAERARAVGLLQQYVSLMLPVCIGPPIVECRRSKQVAIWKIWVQFGLSQTATFVRRRPGFFNILRKKWLTCRVPAPCCGIPTVLALFYVVLRHMIMEMLSVFLSNETFSKWYLWKKLLQMQSLELHVHFFIFEHFPLCMWSSTEYLNNYHGNRRS